MTTRRRMPAGRLALLGAPLLAALALAPPARADVSAADVAAMGAIFEDGRRLLDAGSYAAAAEKFKAAIALSPTVGAYLNLGDAYEKGGKTASAVGAFTGAGIVARKLGDGTGDAEAKRRIQLLEPRLSRVRFDVAPASHGVGVVLQSDGLVIPEGAWDTAIPVDPGEHVIQAWRPGKQPWRLTITVRPEPGTTVVQVPALPGAVLAEGPGQPFPGPFLMGPAPSEPPPAPRGQGQRIGGIVVGSVGVTLGVVGVVLGVVALGKNNELNALCIGGNKCPVVAQSLVQSAHTMTVAATSVGIAGGALLATGIVLFATAPSRSDPTTARLARFEVAPAVGMGTSGLSLRGHW